MSTPVFRLAGEPSASVAVVQAGLACCGLEVDSAVASGHLIADGDDPAGAGILLVAGTITAAMVAPLGVLLATMADDVRIVAFGACATSGGPYWDAPMVIAGFDEAFPDRDVSLYVPGCPPTPGALAAALREIARVSP